MWTYKLEIVMAVCGLLFNLSALKRAIPFYIFKEKKNYHFIFADTLTLNFLFYSEMICSYINICSLF